MSYQSDSLDNNTLAYASFLAGLAAIFSPLIVTCCAPLASLIAIVCGVLYKVRHDKVPENNKDMVLSYSGIAGGVLGAIFYIALIAF